MKENKKPNYLLNRSRKMLKTSFSILKDEALNQVKNKVNQSPISRLKQVKEITETLSQLKGGAMKVGQMLTLEAQEWLPKEAVDIINSLQKDSEVIDFSIMEQVIKEELPGNIQDKMTVNKNPIASASIGQVYKGKFNSKTVVFKIQYPQIDSSIDSDLKLLKPLVKSISLLMGKKIDYDPFFEEIRTVLKNEVDYNREALILKEYKGFLKDSPDYIVPCVLQEASSKHILTMSFEEGITITQWIESRPNKAMKNKVAHLLIDLFIKEFFQMGLVQTDPNPANFLIQEEPLKLVLLDLGASIKYETSFIEDYKEMIKAVIDDDKSKIISLFKESKLISSKESDKCFEAFYEMQKLAAKPFLKQYQPFEFNGDEYMKETREAVINFIKSIKYSSPPREFIFLHRKLGGIFLLLKKMDVKIDLHKLWESNFKKPQ